MISEENRCTADSRLCWTMCQPSQSADEANTKAMSASQNGHVATVDSIVHRESMKVRYEVDSATLATADICCRQSLMRTLGWDQLDRPQWREKSCTADNHGFGSPTNRWDATSARRQCVMQRHGSARATAYSATNVGAGVGLRWLQADPGSGYHAFQQLRAERRNDIETFACARVFSWSPVPGMSPQRAYS